MSVDAAPVPNGRYFIVNNVTTPNGALSVNRMIGNNDDPLTLTSYGTQCGSVWNFTRHDDNTYKISAYGFPYEVVESGGILTTVNYSTPRNWTIKKTEGLYTIQDTGKPVFWAVQEAKPGEQITLGQESSGNGLSGWWLLPGVGCA